MGNKGIAGKPLLIFMSSDRKLERLFYTYDITPGKAPYLNEIIYFWNNLFHNSTK